MLREKLKHFRTIKLRRHHYILGGFGIAAIVVFASIFGFQKIGTHAKTYDPSIAIPDNNICTVINDTQVDVNGTGEINVYCRLGVCVYPELPVPNTGLHYNSDIINVYNNGSATCLVACDEGNEGNEGSEGNEGIQSRTDCNSTINLDDVKTLQYDNVFTFTFQGISAGTSDIRLLANSFQGTGGGNNAADGQEITVRGMETSPGKTGCQIDISNTNIQINQAGTATVSCKGTLTQSPQDPQNNVIDYDPTIIDLSKGTCGWNDDTYYCNFTYTGKADGISQFNLPAHSVFGNDKRVIGDTITVGAPLTSVSCSWPENTVKVDAGDEGTIDLTCTTSNLPSFDDMRSIITITNNDDQIIKPGNITKNESGKDTIYTLSFTGNNSGSVELNINGVLELKGDSYSFSDKGTKGTIIVNGKSTPSGGPTCSIIANPETLNVTQHGEIIVTCTGESKSKPTFDSNLIAATNALDYSQEIITVTKDPSQNLEYEEGPWKLTLVYDFEGSKSGESKLGFYANVIADDYGRNGAVQGKSIVVTDDVILCAWNKSLDTPIDQYTTGSIGLTCSSGSATPNEIKSIMAYKALILGIEDVSTPQEFATANGVQYNYTVTYKGLHEGTGTLSLSGRIANGTLVTDNGFVSKEIEVKPIDVISTMTCSWGQPEPDRAIEIGDLGKIQFTCSGGELPKDYRITTNIYATSNGILYYDANLVQNNNGIYTFGVDYTGAHQGSTQFYITGTLSNGVEITSDKSSTITVNAQPMNCTIVASPDTVDVNGTGEIIVSCKASKIGDNLYSTGLEYESGHITVEDTATKVFDSNSHEYTFTFLYTGEVPIQNSTLKLKEGVISDEFSTNVAAQYNSGITVRGAIPDCLSGWDNDYFITTEFWSKNPTDAEIACALFGSGGEDQTAYTMGWSGYKGGESCYPYYSMNVEEVSNLEGISLSENTIYVLTSTGFTINERILLPGCSALISKETEGKDTEIKVTANQGIGMNNSYSILDNLSIYGANGGAGIGIYLQGSSNTLNVVKVYNRGVGVFLDGTSFNLLNNIQAYANEKGIHIKSEKNAINNTQLYRNEIGLDIDHSQNNMVYNVEIYQNITGLNIGEQSSNNKFRDIELLENKLNTYVLSGFESLNSAQGTVKQDPATKKYDFLGELLDENTNLISLVSGFDRVLLKQDLQKRYRFNCEGGQSATYTYTGNNPQDLTGTAEEICTSENRGDYLGTYNLNTGWSNPVVIETRPLLTLRTGDSFTYGGYSYPDYITNPKFTDGNYLSEFMLNRIDYGNDLISTNVQAYSYGYQINTQKDTKLRDSTAGGLVNTKYFIGSNVVKHNINGTYVKHHKVHYSLTGSSTNTSASEIDKYNIITELYPNVPSTILWYTGPTWFKQYGSNIPNRFDGLDINSGVEIYVKTGDTTSYPVVVQMYGEEDPASMIRDAEYFAEHKYVGTLNRQAPSLTVEPADMCVKNSPITMTGRWVGYEYDMTGFDFTDITVQNNANKVDNSFSKIGTGLYTWQISLSGKTGKVIVESNRAEDILEFQNPEIFEKTYYLDNEGPVIIDNSFTVNECTRKILDISASDYCAGIDKYQMGGVLGAGNIGRRDSSIFRISADTIGRSGGITKTGLVYVRDRFGYESSRTITGTINNIQPTVATGISAAQPYMYGNIDGTTTIGNVIELLQATEGACGVADLTVESVSCNNNAAGYVGENNSIQIVPSANGDILCSVTIKDDENTSGVGYIKFTADDLTFNNYNCHWSTPVPQRLRVGEVGHISLICDNIDFSDFSSNDIANIKSNISTSNASVLNYNVGNDITITYTGNSAGTTNFLFAGAQVNGTTHLASSIASASITVYTDINSGCTWGNPTQNPIGVGVDAYIDLICDNFEYHTENAYGVWDVISYSGMINAINTGNAEYLTSGVRFYYTGSHTGNIQLLASGDAQGDYYNSNGWSNDIEVIDYESNRPGCTIEGTEMVTLGQAGIITVNCKNDYGIMTESLTNNDLDYSGNIIVSQTSTTVSGTGSQKEFIFIFTGDIAGVSNLGLRTGAVMTVPGIVNRYATGNDITVVKGDNGVLYCSWKDPEPSTIGLWGIGTMELDCITDPRIEGFLNKSGTSVAGILSLDNPSGPRVLHYTGTQDGNTQFAISGTIGNVHIETHNNYRSNPITVKSSAPVCTVSYNPTQEAGWTSGNVIATLNCPEGVTVTNNGGIFTHEFTNNGEFTFTYEDEANNTGSRLAEVTWIDKEKPNSGTILVNDNASHTNNPNVILTLSATDTGAGMTGGRMRFSCNTSTWSEWEPYNTTKNWNLNNGSGCTSGDAYKTVRVQYKDALGNGPKEAYDSIRLDTIAPTCNITGNPTNRTNDNVTLKLNPETNAKYSWDGITFTTSNTKTALLNGIYTGYIRDVAGNTSSCSIEVTNIDKIRPECTISVQPTKSPISLVEGYNTGKVVFKCIDTGSLISTMSLTSGAIAHTNSVVTLSDNAITGSVENGVTYEFTYTAKAAGSSTFRLSASKVRDNANNTNSASPTSNAVVVETTAPVCGEITYTPSTWTNGNVTGSFTASDNGAGLQTTSPQLRTFTDNGSQTVIFTDNVGNSVTCTGNVDWIDRNRPTVNFSSENGAIANSHSVVVTVNDVEDGLRVNQSVRYKWTTGTTCGEDGYTQQATLSPTTLGATTATGTIDTVGLEDGSYYLCIKAGSVTDQAGNTNAEAKTTGVFEVKNTAPIAPLCTSDLACFSGSIAVSCTASETIHYTTDGSTPTCSSPVWNNPTFNETTTLKVIACDGASNASQPNTYTYTKDISAPSTTVSGVPSGWTGSNVTITLTPSSNNGCNSDNTTYYCVANSGSTCTPATQGTSVSVECGEGSVCEKYVRYYSVDGLGNTEDTKETAVIKIDKKSPVCGEITYTPSTWTNGNVTGSFTASDNGAGLQTTSPQLRTFTDNGSQTVIFTDKVGNSVTCTGNIDWIDRNAPTVNFSSENGAIANSHSVVVTVNDVEDGLRVNQSVRYKWTTGTTCGEDGYTQQATLSPTTLGATTATGTIDTVGLEDGSYYLCIKAGSVTDQAGNTNAEAKTTGVFVVKNELPATPTCNTTNACFSGSVAASCSASDTIHYTTDENTPTCSSPVWDNPTFNTTTTLKVIACDGAGNASAENTYTYTLDETAPTTTASGVPTGWTGNNVTITLTASTDHGCNTENTTYYCVYESGATACTPTTQGTSVSVECGEGSVCEKYVRYYSVDGLGNTEDTKETAVIKIDKKSPVCGEVTYTPDTWTKGNVTGSFTASDNGAGLQTTSPQLRTFTDNGSQTVIFTDNVGNSVTCTGNVDWIDRDEATGEIITTYPSGHLVNGCTSGAVTLTLSGSDIHGLATAPYSWNGVDWTGNATMTLTENGHGTGYIKDAAGNILELPYNVTGISLSGPDVSLSTPSSGSILTGSVEFTWTAAVNNPTCQALSGGYNIVVYSGTDEVYTGNTGGTQINTVLPDGTYTWKVYTTDILGHSVTSQTWLLIINRQAPTCNIDYTPAESLGWTSGDVQSVLTGCSIGATGFNATGHLFTGNTTYEFTFTNELGITGNAIANVWRIDKVPPVLEEVTPIGTTTDTTPDYTFSSTESGSIVYSGSCSSSTTSIQSGNNTITLNTLALGTYSDCYIIATDKAGNTGELHISDFTIKSSGGGGGGGGGGTLRKDDCPDGDYSDSYYDGTCGGSHDSDETMDICKVNESHFPDEMKLAYLYAYVHGMTTMCPIDDANLYGYLRRDHLAKILTQYSINVLDLEPELGKAGCNDFDDIANESAEMKYFIKTSCELGLMGLQSDGKTPKKSFEPTKYVTRAEFGTTLSRLIYEGKYNLASEAENTYPGAWYSKHLQALKKAEIMNEIEGDRPQHIELRGYVMLMVMRYGKGRLADMVTDKNANSYYMKNIYNQSKEMSCTVYSGGKKVGDLYIDGTDIKQYNKTSGVSVLIKNNVLYTWSDSSNKGVSKKYTTSVFNFLKRFDDEEISVQCTQGVDSDELVKPKDITFLNV